jgi:hypothetical protein
MPLQYVDREDIGGALKRAGSTKLNIDSQDYENVLINELADPHVRIDNEDIPTIAGEGATDTTLPLVSGFSPLDNAVDVAVDANFTVSFDTPIAFATVAKLFTLKLTADDSTIDSWDVDADVGNGAGQCEIVGNAVVLHLTAPLLAATEYYVVWEAGVVTDLSGNPVAAQASTTAWSFTTAA